MVLQSKLLRIILNAYMEKINRNTDKIMRQPIWGTLYGSCIFSFCELSLLFIKMTIEYKIIFNIIIINNNTLRSRLNLIDSVSYDGQTCNTCDIKGHSVWWYFSVFHPSEIQFHDCITFYSHEQQWSSW